MRSEDSGSVSRRCYTAVRGGLSFRADSMVTKHNSRAQKVLQARTSRSIFIKMGKTTSDRRSARKKLSPVIKRQLLMEAGYRCGNPRCTVILAVHILEDHHIKYVSEGGGDELSNLLALCPNCHTLYHHGEIPHEAIRHWKGMLLSMNSSAATSRAGRIAFASLFPCRSWRSSHPSSRSYRPTSRAKSCREVPLGTPCTSPWHRIIAAIFSSHGTANTWQTRANSPIFVESTRCLACLCPLL
jgi:5-methylcytosine-specific restriction endonuclease McrA